MKVILVVATVLLVSQPLYAAVNVCAALSDVFDVDNPTAIIQKVILSVVHRLVA